MGDVLMKTSCLWKINFFVSTFAVSILLIGSAKSALLPAALTANLVQREQRLGETTLAWKITSHASLDANMRKHDRNSLTPERLPPIINGVALWHIAMKGSSTLVSGSGLNSLPKIVPPVYSQFYDGDVGVVVQNPVYGTLKNRAGKSIRINVASGPEVWSSPGDSRLYPCPSSLSLNLAPAHFVTLAGISPLGMYGIHWTLVSETNKAWNIKGLVPLSNSMDRERLFVTLSRAYGGAPTKISCESLQTPKKEDWEVTGFRHYKDIWIGSEVIHHMSAPGIVKTTEDYKLQSVSVSMPLSLPLPKGSQMRDYRLVGDDLSENDIYQANQHHKRGLVYYQWTGHVPTLNDLQQIYQKQHPGEAAPDVSQNGVGASTSTASIINSTLPFAGGILCIIGGVWMFKQRRAN